MAKRCVECGKEFKGKGQICSNCEDAMRHNLYVEPRIPRVGVPPASVRTVPLDEIQGGLMAQFLSDQENKKEEKQFIKNDNGKLQWSLMPFEQLEDVVRVLMYGAKKYERDNWKKCDDINRYKDSLMRHVTAYLEGNKFDNGPGGDNLHHLAHAICNCLFILYFDKGDIEEWNQQLNEKMSV